MVTISDPKNEKIDVVTSANSAPTPHSTNPPSPSDSEKFKWAPGRIKEAHKQPSEHDEHDDRGDLDKRKPILKFAIRPD